MKNNMLRRLALSAVTLGVCALSVTSATYAWFTTQTKTQANQISGTTQASAGNMVIKTKTSEGGTIYSDWTTNATLNAEVASTILKPVAAQKASDASNCSATLDSNFKKNSSNNDTSFSTNIADTDVLHYRVVFALSNLSTTTKSAVKVNISNINSTEQTGTQTLIADAGTGAKKGDKISVNVKEALAMGVCSTILTSSDLKDYDITDSNYSNSITVSNITASNKYYKYQEETSKVNVVGSDNTTTQKEGTALQYYNNVFNVTATAPTTSLYESTYFGTKDEQIELFQISGCTSAYVVSDFYFFIDGWDNQCFSAIGGLGITDGIMKFELNPVESTAKD